MQPFRNSFRLPQNISSDLLDAHLNDVRVWSLDYRTWRFS